MECSQGSNRGQEWRGNRGDLRVVSSTVSRESLVLAEIDRDVNNVVTFPGFISDIPDAIMCDAYDDNDVGR